MSSIKKKALNNGSEKKKETNNSSFKIILIAVAAISFLVLLAIALAWSPNEEFNEFPNETHDWYFQGAYANYEGSTTYLFITVNFSLRLEIVDFNSTHIKSLFDIKLKSVPLGTLFNEQDTKWAPIEELGTFAWQEMEGYNLTAEYDDQVYIEEIGTKNCKICEFTQTEDEPTNMKITVYADPKIQWPLKITFKMNIENNQNIDIDIKLKDTNISKLK